MEEFLKAIFSIREDLRIVVLLVMLEKDWIGFNKTTHCHISKKSLVKESFLDPSLFVREMGAVIAGRRTKKCHYKEYDCS